MRRYRAHFTGRLIGAIGVFYSHTITVEAENKEQAEIKLYETHEHITNAKIEEIDSRETGLILRS